MKFNRKSQCKKQCYTKYHQTNCQKYFHNHLWWCSQSNSQFRNYMRPLQSPQACTHFMPFLLPEYVNDPHVFLEVFLHLDRTTFSTKYEATFTQNNIQYKIWGCIQLCPYWFQASISMLPNHIKLVKIFEI